MRPWNEPWRRDGHGALRQGSGKWVKQNWRKNKKQVHQNVLAVELGAAREKNQDTLHHFFRGIEKFKKNTRKYPSQQLNTIDKTRTKIWQALCLWLWTNIYGTGRDKPWRQGGKKVWLGKFKTAEKKSDANGTSENWRRYRDKLRECRARKNNIVVVT